MTELKRCPCCGRKPLIQHVWPDAGNNYFASVYVECPGCLRSTMTHDRYAIGLDDEGVEELLDDMTEDAAFEWNFHAEPKEDER